MTPGDTYKLYAFFWSPNDINQQWLLRAGLSNVVGDLPSWTRLNNDAANNPSGVVGTDNDSYLIATDSLAPFPALGPALQSGQDCWTRDQRAFRSPVDEIADLTCLTGFGQSSTSLRGRQS